MYSYTVTGIQNIHPPEPNEPKLRIQCKSGRRLIQEEIYTCLGCTNYCSHYCTVPEIIAYQCRNCLVVAESVKNNRCKQCFSCPYCSNVLVMVRDKNKKYILLCQFCYWNTKEIDVVGDKAENLISQLNKLSANMRESQVKLYNASQGFFKEVLAINDYEKQVAKYTATSSSGTNNPVGKKTYKRSQEESLQDTKKQIERTCDNLVKRVGLEDVCEDYEGEMKVPQNLPLLAKKVRRCPECKKPLTTTFRNKSGEQKVELMFKDVKILQCQRLPAQDGKVFVKYLRDLSINDEEIGPTGTIKEVEVNKIFQVKINIINKTKGTTNSIVYDFIVESQ